MNDTLQKVLGSLGRFLLYNVFVDIVLFHLGRVALLLITAGRYPRGRQVALHANRIRFFGVLIVVMAWCVLAAYNNFFTRYSVLKV
jgi:hypothetical protein